jgi:hypothetical protein
MGAGVLLATTPRKVADFIHKELITYFTPGKRGRFGIVITDYEQTDINSRIIATNEFKAQ